MTVSNKKYSTAVILSGIFGVLGIHHFYVERWLMGLFDLGLSITSFMLFISGKPVAGAIFLSIDFIHTVYVTYKLLVGEYKDGSGKIIAYPGQTINN